jgi:hypothetical protein
MKTFNIHEAKTHLSRLIELAMLGEDFIIAKAGKPLVKVSRISQDVSLHKNRIGLLEGQSIVPDDFDVLGASEIASLFGLK